MDNKKYLRQIKVGSREFDFFSLRAYAEESGQSLEHFPFSIRILLEGLLRNCDGVEVEAEHIKALAAYNPQKVAKIEVPFKPARVLLQDFTGVPCVVDLAAMRSAMQRLGGDPRRINPEQGVDLIIDHSVQVDHFNSPDAFRLNAELEFERNRERYELLRWGQGSLANFSVVPPASGICHQVNLEYLGKVVQVKEIDGAQVAYFDSCIGTDSHTPMINGLGIIGWGVGGIEAEAAMLGQPVGMLAPAVVGVNLVGKLRQGITATDLVLRITEMLRKHGVVGKFVEFLGEGLSAMSVPDRATISNMAPEYGATMGYFPVDHRTLEYMYQTGRSQEQIDLAEAYAREQGVFRSKTGSGKQPQFEALLELDLDSVVPAVAGPKRPQDRIALTELPAAWKKLLKAPRAELGYGLSDDELQSSGNVKLNSVMARGAASGDAGAGGSAAGEQITLHHGDVVIAAITSCTNTSNPSVLLTAGLLAKRAVEKGLRRKPWVKTSFAPGSVVVTEYLKRAGLLEYLEQLGFYLVGYGCTTCIGNSGPLPAEIEQAVLGNDLVVAGVLSGNRNFEGRVNPLTKANFLTSPPLVVAYALTGSVAGNVATDSLGTGSDGKPVYLRDIWPQEDELQAAVAKAMDRDEFLKSYQNIEESNPEWNSINFKSAEIYDWNSKSTYILEPPFFVDMPAKAPGITSIKDARVLVWAGDSVTTDHISPAGAIDPNSPAGKYLREQGVDKQHFNSYGSRRGNDQIMARGTFANIRFRNRLTPDVEGSSTLYHPDGSACDIFSAAEQYKQQNIPTIVLAGKDYGMGSSRDWAAKGPRLLGVSAVIAESYERIHRSNLIGMGILPMQFMDGQSADSLGLRGNEYFDIVIDDNLAPRQQIEVTARRVGGDGKPDASQEAIQFSVQCRIDSLIETHYYRNGGILQFVLRKFLQKQ